MGKLQFSLEDFQKAAAAFKKQLLRLPVLGINDTIQYMTPMPGVTYETIVGSSSVNAQLAPYKAGRRTDADLELNLRALRTYFGSVNADFEPNSAIQTLLGHKAAQAMGDAQSATVTAREVLALIGKQVSATLNDHIWDAKRNADGSTTADLFDGFDTITEKDIAEGKISEANKNYKKLTEPITSENAVDVLKDILFSLDPNLRKEDCFLFCDYATADAYNEAYLMGHTGIVYNDRYNQVSVEGSNNKLTIVPLANKSGSKFLHIAPKANMLVGFDQMSDAENVMVKEYAPDVLTFMLRMFFGVQFESVDSRRLFVAELAD
ncbi:MAG: hypothetical protein NC217_07745 [Muribaculaceae bacterium]|nr:hypothetical protein [Muribaculaceae bacterium]